MVLNAFTQGSHKELLVNKLTYKSWSPYMVGAGIGMLSWFAFVSADHPIGVTTAFEHTAALALKAAPGIQQLNEYFAKQAAEGKRPKIDWEWMLVVGVFLGAFASSKLSGDRDKVVVPKLWEQRFGPSALLRLVVAFLAGALMMFGARLAQGCTSGHGISGTMQLAVSSWLFIIVAFGVATITTFLLFGKGDAHHG